MDPVIEEFCRVSAPALQVHVFRRMQRYFGSELGPKVDRLEAENAELRAQVAAYEAADTRKRPSKKSEDTQPV